MKDQRFKLVNEQCVKSKNIQERQESLRVDGGAGANIDTEVKTMLTFAEQEVGQEMSER